mgnify:CR=1 FL=1
MVVKQFSKTGSYHDQLSKENQDYLCKIEGKDYLAIMLADGATACEMGLEGAKLACEAAVQIVQKEGNIFFNYPKEKIAFLLTEQILYWLECNTEQGKDIREYGSTFLMAFMEKKTGRTVLVNLGDGAIISVTEKGFYYLMKPKKIRGNPCLTTTKGASQAISIDIKNLSLGENIILCSDGFINQLSNEDIVVVLNKYDLESVNNKLQMRDNADDCSYISFVRERR